MSQSVRRAARILDALAEEPRAVTELAAEFAVHRTTMFRELRSLEEVGFARRRGDGRYTLGLHLITLSKRAFLDLDLREIAHDHLRALHRETGFTLHLAALMEDSIVYVDKVEDPNGLRMYSRIGKAAIPYCSGVGKAIMAGLDDLTRDAILDRVEWRLFTRNTLADRAALDAELVRVAARGYALDDAEFEEFVNCIAVPIRSSAGVVGALSLTAVRVALGPEGLRERLPALRAAAESIGHELG